MESKKFSVVLNGLPQTQTRIQGRTQTRIVRRVIGIAGGVAAAVAALGAANAKAVVIQPTTADNVPISNPTSVFDASNTGNTYSLESGTNFIPAGFDARDLFGGSFGTFGPEQNDVIFDNNQPMGTIEAIDVTLSAPVSLTSFNLFLEDDGTTGDRSAREFMLFSNGQLIDDVPILDSTGTQSYTSQYGSNYIDISDTLSGLPASSDYTLELVQNRDGNGTSGIRALDFDATGNSGTSVPEPASMAGLIVSGIALSKRRRRT